jgi:hypothetical protein
LPEVHGRLAENRSIIAGTIEDMVMVEVTELRSLPRIGDGGIITILLSGQKAPDDETAVKRS